MTWVRFGDETARGAPYTTLARNRFDLRLLVGTIVVLTLEASAARSDGFLPEFVVRQWTSRGLLERLTNPPHGGTSLLHSRSDFEGGGRTCECLKGAAWPPGAAYVVHGYLDTNPSRDETDVARAKSAELRDRELREQVRARDGDACRYCGVAVRWSDHRSGTGGVLDHVDPAYAAGAANLVVACRNCNSRKGARTPAAAGLRLLAAPPNPRTTRGPGTHVPGRDGTGRAEQPATVEAVAEELSDAAGQRVVDTPAPTTATADAGGTRPGRGGRTGPARTPRTSANPDPYRRRAITGPMPENHAGLPPDPHRQSGPDP